MIRQTLTPTEAISILKELVTADPEAMHALCEHRVPCNSVMEAHPSAQVAGHEGVVRIGMLGVLNALFGTMGPEAGRFENYGIIAAVYNAQGKLIDFQATDPALPILQVGPGPIA